jgi:phytanoyl-CoA hydroxylase
MEPLTNQLVQQFWGDGFLVLKSLAPAAVVEDMKQLCEAHLSQHVAPVEYEVDVGYPGAPVSADAEGAQTPRRMLHAFARHPLFRDWATGGQVKQVLSRLFGTDDVALSQCHHNCIMTKHPGYSSATLWHQDNRYWSFDQENLISVWLALGSETRANGCLRVIPGTHRTHIPPGRFDAALFLRTDLEANKTLLGQAVPCELEPGDVLFFHSKLFHAAGRNRTPDIKLSLVFTYHEGSNRPIDNTRSARFPGVSLA